MSIQPTVTKVNAQSTSAAPKPGGPGMQLSRREFCASTMLALAALSLPLGYATASNTPPAGNAAELDVMMRNLLREWCDAMMALQIHNPANPAENGALACTSCGIIHGRCWEAVYPLLHMAKITGDPKYLNAGIAAFGWSENVSQANGSWTVVADPKSWNGITVFGAIALAEALHHHGDLLDEATRQRWLVRLGRAGDFIHQKFTPLDWTNINYGSTAVYGLHLLGEVLNRPAYQARSRELAGQVKDYLTQPNHLVFGENHPATGKSARGLMSVDLGYNVEETISNLALYAAASKDAEFTALITPVLQSHLEFMLPDGGWDNSWGTRDYKWTYWGSRTCDGCQPGFAVLAPANPAFGTAVYQNTQLLRRCTHNGLLYGGLDYVSHGVKPCVHHTFAHAKALATVLDHGNLASSIPTTAPLPRATAEGVKEFPEIATSLVARGPWRATITAYDAIYKSGVYHPTGGTLSLLWHRDVGPLLAGSLAEYVMVEEYNMQPNPDKADHPLTPRLEAWENGTWFTNLHDWEATVAHTENAADIKFEIGTRLLSANQKAPTAGPLKGLLKYNFDGATVTFRAKTDQSNSGTLKTALVLPVISPTGEQVRQVSDRRIEITKPSGTVVVEANAPLRIQETGKARIFNMVPGFEAVPIVAELLPGPDFELECRISVNA